jgi:hypothetical protein
MLKHFFDSSFPGFFIVDDEIVDLTIAVKQCQTIWIHKKGLEELYAFDLTEIDHDLVFVVVGRAGNEYQSSVCQNQRSSHCDVVVKMTGTFFK